MRYGSNFKPKIKNQMHQVLDAPDKQINKTYGANGAISRLWRTMLLDLNIGGARFSEILHEHVTNPINGVPNNKKDQISYRGNLTKEFSKSQMTWKVFMKALRFMNIINVELVIVATHLNKQKTVHRTSVNLGSRHTPNDFIKMLNQEEVKEAVVEVPFLDNDQILDLVEEQEV